MTIASDINVDYTNKIIKLDVTASGIVFSVNELYSHIMDTFDELAQMDDTVPMSAQTPTSYTMTNGWYLQEELTQYLEGGAIQTDGYTDEIRTLIGGAAGWTTWVAADVGDLIEGSVTGDTGNVLDYDNSAYKVWVRMTGATDEFDDDGEDYTGAGDGTATATAVSTTGEHIFANPYTLGTLEGTPQLYIFQDGERLSEWWTTGHFDVLVKVTESDVDFDSKKITVFGRNWTDLYTHFEITLTTAGQNAVPLGSSDDLNNQTAEGTVEDWQDGTTSSIDINFSFTTPFSYNIGDGNGVQDYEVQIDCNSQSLANVYEVCKYWTRTGSTTQLETTSSGNYADGEEYISASEGVYANVVASPFGTFAGGKFFGARSVYFINLHGDDAQAFQLIDKAGTTRYPPNYQAFSVNGVENGDRVTVFLADAGEVDKEQYWLNSSNLLNTLTVSGSIPSDTPSTGTITVVDDDNSEISYAYSAWSGADFTVSISADVYTGTETAYVPYIYEQATGTSVSETTTIYSTNRDVICKVRKAGILPFVTTGSYTATGYSATAIRTTDSIYTVI